MVLAGPSLRDLCSICYTQKPKYRCPRCKTQSCSLACYKRHQQRASCNGKRNPAAYQKKSQLATPASVDQDYNYLKSVEREIDHAGKATLERGIGDRTASSKCFIRATHPESNLQRYLVQNRIRINRAPLGMSRQRSNQTRVSHRQHAMWTVEWFEDDGSNELQNDFPGSDTIGQLYDLMRLVRSNAAKRKLMGEHSSELNTGTRSKRRRASNRGSVKQLSNSATRSISIPEPSTEPDISVENNPSADEHEPQAANKPSSESIPQDLPDRDPSTGAQESERPSTPHDLISDNPAHQSEESHSTGLSFYLHKPNIQSSARVLIPLSPSATLTDCLRNREVNEYPTIYALSHGPTSLPSGFITEEQFLSLPRPQEDRPVSQNTANNGGSFRRSSQVPVSGAREEVDSKRILDMLMRRDFAM